MNAPHQWRRILGSVIGTVRHRLGQALFLRVAGPDGARHRDRIHRTPGPRWFDPASPIGRVHGDASMFVGGIRAILLQTLHPAAMTAVAEHSGYRGDMWGRLARTSRFIAVTTFGTADDAQRAVDAVRVDPRTGYGNHAGRYVVRRVRPAPAAVGPRRGGGQLPAAHQAYGKHPLDQAERDEYVAQTAEVARRLGVLDPPTTEAELAETLAAFRPELRATGHARDAVSYLLWRPPLPRRPAPGVRRADGGRDRADAAMDQTPPSPAVAPGLGPHGRQGARHPRHRHDPLGDGARARRGAGAARLGVRGGRVTDLPARWPLVGDEAVRDDLLVAYADPARGYHDTRHLTEVLDRLDELADAGTSFDRVQVGLAAWFHDGVYDGQPDAEERSAVWAETALGRARPGPGRRGCPAGPAHRDPPAGRRRPERLRPLRRRPGDPGRARASLRGVRRRRPSRVRPRLRRRLPGRTRGRAERPAGQAAAVPHRPRRRALGAGRARERRG